VALVVYLLSSVDLGELGRRLAAANWAWVTAAVAAGLIGLFARARRWRWLFPPGPEPPGIVAATMIGYMANNVLPLRAGEVVRIYVLARKLRESGEATRAESFWLVTATLIVERVLDSLAIVLMLAVLVFTIRVPRVVEWAAGVLFTIDVVGVSTLVTIARAPERCRRLLLRLTGRWPRVSQLIVSVFDTGLRGLEGIRALAHLPRLAAWTALVWLMPAAAAWAMLRAVHLDLPFGAGWTVLAFVGVGISVPSAPGYVGVFHAAATAALELFGVPRSTALAYAVLYHASALVPITVVGWLFLLREHVSLGEARRAPTVA
jgi:glycosyltransferase 2 family protein